MAEVKFGDVLKLAGFLGAAGVGLLYLARICKREVDFLKSTTICSCSELANLIDSQGEEQSLIVAISGRVGSMTPIHCKLSGLEGVVVQEQFEVHFKRKNDAGSWIKDSVLMPCTYTEVPWYVDDGTGQHVFIRGASVASCFTWPVEKETFEKSVRTANLIKSLEAEEIETLLSANTPFHVLGKTVGVKRMEWLLPTSTSLTVVGKAVKDDSGRVWIERPRNPEGPFYVSPRTMDEIIDHLQQTAWYSKGIAAFCMMPAAMLAFLFSLSIAHYALIDDVRETSTSLAFIKSLGLLRESHYSI